MVLFMELNIVVELEKPQQTNYQTLIQYNLILSWLLVSNMTFSKSL